MNAAAPNPNLDQAWTCMAILKVLIIDGDEALGTALGLALGQSGLATAYAATGAAGLELKQRFSPDVILLDSRLPDTDGLSLVKKFAKSGDCGVIVISGLVDEADRVVGLELGADDYVCKPPNVRELLARIRAVNRRSNLRVALGAAPAEHDTVGLGDMILDLKNRTIVSDHNVKIGVTAAEFAALETLIAAKGETVSRNCLSEAALQRPWRPEDRSVDQLIFNLRQKLSEHPRRPAILSIRGAGYVLCVTSAVTARPLQMADR